MTLNKSLACRSPTQSAYLGLNRIIERQAPVGGASVPDEVPEDFLPKVASPMQVVIARRLSTIPPRLRESGLRFANRPTDVGVGDDEGCFVTQVPFSLLLLEIELKMPT